MIVQQMFHLHWSKTSPTLIFFIEHLAKKLSLCSLAAHTRYVLSTMHNKCNNAMRCYIDKKIFISTLFLWKDHEKIMEPQSELVGTCMESSTTWNLDQKAKKKTFCALNAVFCLASQAETQYTSRVELRPPLHAQPWFHPRCETKYYTLYK